MDIILFGMQGSGKGTQGKILSEKFGLKSFDMGGQLRNIIDSDSPLGNKIKGIVASGSLVDDDTIMEVVNNFLTNIPDGQSVLFDGIPRTLNQCDKLVDIIKSKKRDAFAVFIKISEQEAIKRVTQRRICKECKGVYPPNYKSDKCLTCGGDLIVRQDDNPESIRKRLDTYTKETIPVIKSFYNRDHLIEVDGEQDVERVSAEMLEKVGYLFS